jgi:predicted DNA-binding transcriptional regulator YafY
MSAKKGKMSSWRVADRCLHILVRLMSGPAKSGELLEIVLDRAIADGESTERNALLKRFEEDRGRLKNWLCEIQYNRPDDEYELIGLKRPLFDLTPKAVHGLAFLQASFSVPNMPMRDDVNALIDNLMLVLSQERRREIVKQRGVLEFEMNARDDDVISPEVWDAVQRVCNEPQLLQFDYLSPRHETGIKRRHLVEPMRHFYSATRGHFYLEAYCLESWGEQHSTPRQVITYRMGRMSNVVVLPTRFRRDSRRIPKHDLVYELKPEVARLGVTQYFDDSQVIPHDDGGATVRALSSNLFFDLRTLLHYGANCRVVGGERAVSEMRSIVKAMYEGYFSASS